MGSERSSQPAGTRRAARVMGNASDEVWGKECLPHQSTICYCPTVMVEITISLPDMLAHALGATPEARSQRLTEDAAVEEYRAGRLSHRQVGEMLGLDYWQTERFLTERHVPLNYSLGDLEADRATLHKVLGHP